MFFTSRAVCGHFRSDIRICLLWGVVVDGTVTLRLASRPHSRRGQWLSVRFTSYTLDPRPYTLHPTPYRLTAPTRWRKMVFMMHTRRDSKRRRGPAIPATFGEPRGNPVGHLSKWPVRGTNHRRTLFHQLTQFPLLRALPNETRVESGTSQSKSRTSVNLSGNLSNRGRKVHKMFALDYV